MAKNLKKNIQNKIKQKDALHQYVTKLYLNY